MENTSDAQSDSAQKPLNVAVKPPRVSIFQRLKKMVWSPINFRALWALAVRITLVLVVAGLLLVVYRELTNKTYRIQVISMPEEFEKDGYNGVVMARRILAWVYDMERSANMRRSLREVDEYNHDDDRIKIQVDVAGVGISPDAIASFIRRALGIPERSITIAVARNGSDLDLFLHISGLPQRKISVPLDVNDRYESLAELGFKGAEEILSSNNPLLGGLHYYDENKCFLAIECFQRSIRTQPETKAIAYAHWGDAVGVMSGDTVASFSILRKSIELDPHNGTPWRIMGNLTRHLSPKRAEAYYREAIRREPTSGYNWFVLAVRILDEDPARLDETIHSFEKVTQLDSRLPVALELSRALFVKGQYDKALAALAQEDGASPMSAAITIAVYESLRDSAFARAVFEDALKNYRHDALGIELNDIAFRLEQHGSYASAFHLVALALEADNSSRRAGITYSTLAELYGLTNNDEGFYSAYEHALQLGLPVEETPMDLEPYSRFAKDERFQKLLARYSRPGKN